MLFKRSQETSFCLYVCFLNGPKKLVFVCKLFKRSQETSFCSYVWKDYYWFSGTTIPLLFACNVLCFYSIASLCFWYFFCAFLCFWCVQILFVKKKEFKTVLITPFTIWGYQDNFKPVFLFFLQKYIARTKTLTIKNQLTKQK